MFLVFSYISELAERVIILTRMKLIMIMVLNYDVVTLQLCVDENTNYIIIGHMEHMTTLPWLVSLNAVSLIF